MMKKLSIVILLLIAGAWQLHGQNSKVTSGVMALDANNVGEAISKLEEGIANKALFTKNTKPVSKAYYNLHKAYLRVANAGEDPTLADLKKKYPDAAWRSKVYLDSAYNSLDGAEYKKRFVLDNNTQGLWYALFFEGASLFDAQKHAESLKYINAAEEVSPGIFLTSRLMGPIYLALADTANAVTWLEKSISLYKTRYITPKPEELAKLRENATFVQELKQDSGQLSYVYRQLAVVYNAQKEPQKALTLLEEGIALTGDKDISTIELSIYQQNPSLFEGAVKKFEAAIAKDPSNNTIKLAYASMLERNKQNEKAMELYTQVLSTDNSSIEAHYGLGASYINQAAALSEEKAKTNNEKKIDELNERILALLDKAYPHMKFLHEQQPNEREWLSQLVVITGNTNRMDEMEAYGKKLAAMNK